MFETFSKLRQANLATLSGFPRLLTSIGSSGTNLMALLRFAARTYPSNTAIVDDKTTLSYETLYLQTQQLAAGLYLQYQIKAGTKVALLCRNHAALAKTVFALSALGAHAYLLNVEMNEDQFDALLKKHRFDLVIYDLEVWELLNNSIFDKTSLLSYHLTFPSIDTLSQETTKASLHYPKGSNGQLVILTGGTTGQFKTAVRKPSVFNFLNPFFALLNRLDLADFKSVYIATPIYHGFGLSALIMSVTLGVKILLQERFNANRAVSSMLKHQVEVLIVVPVMLQRFITRDKLDLIYVRCILCGGAQLSPSLVQMTLNNYQYNIANLYGTSEAGFSVMATREELTYHPNTIGQAIQGVRLKIVDEQTQELPQGKVGQLYIKSSWTMNSQDAWIPTGDLGYVDANGYYFLCGRSDDMIVSGGENVYPIELENILLKHPAVKEVAAIGIADQEFGQRLKAFVVLNPQQSSTVEELLAWLKENCARYQFPKTLECLEALPRTALGKVDRKQLRD